MLEWNQATNAIHQAQRQLIWHLNKDEFNYRHSSSGGIIIDNGKGHSGARLVLLCP